MTNALTEFKYEGNAIRTFGTKLEPWFSGTDVARILGYQNPERAVRVHVPEKSKGVTKTVTPGGEQEIIIIDEAGLYFLIFRSKMPTAVEFTYWVAHEVLPSIRKYGYYVNPNWGEIPESGRWKLANGRELRGDEIQELAKRIGCDYVENKKINDLVEEIDEYNTIEGKKKRYPYTEKDIQLKVSSMCQEANWYECFIPEGTNWNEYVCYFKDKEDAYYYIVPETPHYSEKFAELVRQIDERESMTDATHQEECGTV